MRFFCACDPDALGSTPARNASCFPATVSRLSQIAAIALQASSFALRHGFAIAVMVITACALWTLCYFALLLWAIISNEGLGGPLAYPAGLLAFFLVSLAMALCLYFPATAIAAGLAKKYQLSFVQQIALCIGLFALLHFIALLAFSDQPSIPVSDRLLIGGTLFLLNLIPLGLYWWCAQGLLVCHQVMKHLLNRLRPKKNAG